MATKAGSSSVSQPSAYVTHAPNEGKPSIVKPVLKKFSPCGCALVCVVKECMKQKSSTMPARFGSRSETIFPVSPRGLKSQNGLAMLPVGPSKVTSGIPGGF